MYDISLIHSEYKDKLITEDFAANLVKSNYRMNFGLGTGCSVYLDRALAKRIQQDELLRGLEIQTEIAIRNDYLETYKINAPVDRVRFYSSHFFNQDRVMQQNGNCWYVPILFNEENLYWGLE